MKDNTSPKSWSSTRGSDASQDNESQNIFPQDNSSGKERSPSPGSHEDAGRGTGLDPEFGQDPQTHPGSLSATDGSASSGDAPNESESLRKEVQELRKELLYLAADFENYKKKSLKERSDLLKYGGERLASRLLDVADNLKRALTLRGLSSNIEDVFSGVEMTHKELMSAFESFGIRELSPEKKAFDPTLHEAIGSQESTDTPEGHVVNVARTGFMYHERLLRPAQVIVSKGAPNP